jgi:hypothetical protein
MASGPHPLVTAAAASNGAPAGGVDLRTSIYQTLIGKGLNPQQAMGVVYSMMGESGTGLDAGSVGDSGNSIGFGQWNGQRRANLEAIAKNMGVAPTDASAQLAHFQAEINGPYAAEIERVKNATSTADATRMWTGSVGEKAGYERPQVNNWQQRVASGAKAGSLVNDAPVWNTPGTAVASSGATAAPGGTSPAQGPPTSVGDALTRLTTPDEKTGKSALDDAAARFAPKRQQQASEPLLAGGGGGAPVGSGFAGPSSQLMQQIITASGKPLSWSSAPYGSGAAGPQVPGMTLTNNPYGGFLG